MRSNGVAKVLRLVIALGAGCAAAPSSDQPGGASGGEPGAGGAAPDAGTAGAVGGASGHSGAGGAPVIRTIMRIDGDPYSPKPCNEVCAAAGATCVVKCTDVGFTHRYQG